MLIFNFETTSYCNAGCPTCYRTMSENLHLNHLYVNDFEYLILDNLKYLRGKEYIIAKFCGELGDPLVHPEIEKLITTAEKVFDKVEVFTNGGVRNTTWIRNALRKHRKLRFVFGIDGLTDEINNLYRVNVNTKKALANMITSTQYNQRLFTRWDFTVFSHNHHQVKNVIDLARMNRIELVVRFNGRDYNKIDDENRKQVKKLLNDHHIGYYECLE